MILIPYATHYLWFHAHVFTGASDIKNHAQLNSTINEKQKGRKMKDFLAFKLSDIVFIMLINVKCQQCICVEYLGCKSQ